MTVDDAIHRPAGSSGFRETRPDGVDIYHQRLADGTYGFYVAQPDGSQIYHRRRDDGSYVRWRILSDGTSEGPLATEPVEPLAGMADAGAEPPIPDSRWRRRGLVVLAACALGLLGFGAAAALASLRGGEAAAVEADARLADIAANPTEAWTFDPTFGDTSGYASAPVITGAGDGVVLVASAFDHARFEADHVTEPFWNPAVEWSEDYDAQYDEGYAAGLALVEDLESWLGSGLTDEADSPSFDDYWPGSGSFLSADPTVDGGRIDGFNDAWNGAGYGAHRLVEPVGAGFSPSLRMVDAASGDTVWETDLSVVVDDARADIVGYDVGADAPVATVITVTDGDGRVSSTLVSLARGTGEVLESVVLPGGELSVAVGEGLAFVAAGASGDDSAVQAYDLADLGFGPIWEARVDGAATLVVHPTFLDVRTDGLAGLDLETGEPVGFSARLAEATHVLEVSGAVLAGAYQESGAGSFMRIGPDGEDLWDAPLEAYYVGLRDGYLVVADAGDDRLGENRRLIDLDTGTPLWGDEVDADHGWAMAVEDGFVYAYDGERLAKVALESGEAVASIPLEAVDVLAAESMLYAVSEGSVVAIDLADLAERWTYEYDASRYSVGTFGDRLALVGLGEIIVLGEGAGVAA
ncbi:outer membrane protein assembly factor BamB family protein [Demequina mangrovi]|uniref:PQQ-like domain-containing protein n=1 Tax=Demequina mangrovi TaxID=1043493 RepID=A0A1H6U843_9MICO|nr:PQQ-binding-like beta-propeller repeat protein [Demequina mangrovi]SEI88548.1 PQQ-like domain-containing protein [Demequina mangrovi]